MYVVICPLCRSEINGQSEDDAMKNYSFHWLIKHEDEEEMGS